MTAKSAEPSYFNVTAYQICMIECAYDAVGCAYLIGLQVALEACNFGKLKSLLFACIMLYGC